MKKTLLLALAVVAGLAARAQAVIESVTTVGNLTVPACTVTFEKDAKLVQDAMNQYLKDQKLKTTKEDGYAVAVNAFVEQISASSVNLYTRVEEQGKKKNRVAVVTAAAISTDLTIDQQTLRGNVRNWLAAFVQYLPRYEAMLQVAAGQADLKKAEKAAASAAADVQAIDKSIAKDQKEIESKKKEIAKYEAKIKALQKEIRDIEAKIEKSGKKREDAAKKADAANQGVQQAEGEVERYRQMAE
ncbi:MAG: hypothetical protein IJ760_04985 [Bacteroidales bacterium]|nr:hypothetical protein [Bacteroidales bacterium]